MTINTGASTDTASDACIELPNCNETFYYLIRSTWQHQDVPEVVRNLLSAAEKVDIAFITRTIILLIKVMKLSFSRGAAGRVDELSFNDPERRYTHHRQLGTEIRLCPVHVYYSW